MTELKLPLAGRKNVRDEFNPYVSEFAAETAKLLGSPWTMEPNWETLLASDRTDYFSKSAGYYMKSFFKSAVDQLSRNIIDVGEKDVVVRAINEACPAKIIAVGLDSQKSSGSGCRLAEGKLWLLFEDGAHIGTATDGTLRELPSMVIDSVSGLSLAVLADVHTRFTTRYLPKFAEDTEKLFGEPWTAEPDWLLCMRNCNDRFKERPGFWMAEFLSAAVNQLESQTKQGSDDLVIETMQEKLYRKTMVVSVDDQITGRSGHKVEDGKLWILFKSGAKFGFDMETSLATLFDSL